MDISSCLEIQTKNLANTCSIMKGQFTRLLGSKKQEVYIVNCENNESKQRT